MTITPLAGRYSYVTETARVPHVQVEAEVALAELAETAGSVRAEGFFGMECENIPGGQSRAYIAKKDLFLSFRITEAEMMKKLLPHMQAEPNNFLYRFSGADFTEKAVSDAMFRSSMLGDEKTLHDLLTSWMERNPNSLLMLGPPCFVSYDLS